MSDFVEKPIKKMLNRQNPDTRLRRVEQRTGARNSTRVRGLEELSLNSNNSSYILLATAYPSEDFFDFVTETGERIAILIASHSIATSPVSSGPELIGFARQAGEIGIAYLGAGDELGNETAQINVRSNGLVQVDMSPATSDAADDQRLQLISNTAATNVVSNLLSLLLRSKGTVAANFGIGIGFAMEDASGNDGSVGSLYLQYSVPTNGAETVVPRMSIIENGALANYPLLNPRNLGSDNLRTTIATTETTVFSITVPANFFAAGGSIFEFECRARLDTNASARTMTARLKIGGTTVTTAQNNGANTVFNFDFRGWVSRVGTDLQAAYLDMKRWNVDLQDAPSGTQNIDYGAPAEDDGAAILIEFTLQVSGTVDSAQFDGFKAFGIGDN